MLAAIASGDPYMWFAKMARLAPEWAVRETHGDIREICKRCCLGVLYGMGYRALAMRIKRSELEAGSCSSITGGFSRHSGPGPAVLCMRPPTYGYIDLDLRLANPPWDEVETGGEDTSPTTLMNAPMQGNGAEMLRLAASSPIRPESPSSPVHDAFLIEAREEDERGRDPDNARVHGSGVTGCARRG